MVSPRGVRPSVRRTKEESMSAEADDLPPQLKAKLQTGVRCIVELVQPQLVILFGSYAEDRAREGSDLDLLVVAETDSRIWAAVALQEARCWRRTQLTCWCVRRRAGKRAGGCGALSHGRLTAKG